MSSALEPRAGATITGLFLGSLAIAGAVALVTAPITPRIAAAQTVAKSSSAEIAPADGRGVDGGVDPLDRRPRDNGRRILPD